MAISDPTSVPTAVPTPTSTPAPVGAPEPGVSDADLSPIVDVLNAITLQVDTLTVALVLVAVLLALVAGFVIVRAMS